MKTGGRVAATGSVVNQCISTGSSVTVAGCVGIERMKTDGRIGGTSWSEAEERVLSLSGIKTRITAVRRRTTACVRFAQGRVAQLDLAPTLAVFASRSVISTPPRFVRDYSAHARLAVFVETHRLRTSDAERDQGVSRKPSLHAIRESRIASSPRPALNPILTVIRYALHSRGA